MTFKFEFDEDYTPSFDFRHGYMTSSLIKEIIYEEVNLNYYHITIKTRNSEYVFSNGTKSDKKPLSDKEITDIAMMFF
jgi:hypothetical protein